MLSIELDFTTQIFHKTGKNPLLYYRATKEKSVSPGYYSALEAEQQGARQKLGREENARRVARATAPRFNRARSRSRKQAVLTGVSHGEAVSHLDHVHLRDQFGNILVVRERKPEHFIFVRIGREQPTCVEKKHTEALNGDIHTSITVRAQSHPLN